MGFSDRLDRVIEEATSDAMLNAQSRVESAKSEQRIKQVERHADQVVDGLDKILRVLKLPELKNQPAIQAMQQQYKNLIIELGNDGTMRRALIASLSTPVQVVPDTRQSIAQQISQFKLK